MFRSLILTFACLAASGLVEAQFENCHTLILTPHHFLDLERFLGHWYPIKTGPSKSSQVRPLNFTCHEANITQTAQENTLDYQEFYLELENGVVTGPGRSDGVVVIGEVNPMEPLPSIWAIHDPAGEKIGEAVVVASDEDKWFIQYSCHIRDGALLERLTLFSRHRYLEPLVEDTLDSIMFGMGFPLGNFLNIEQSQCS